MGFDNGKVVFDRDNRIYYPGETVHGKLIFNQDKEKTFRGLFVKMKGFCHVHWTTRHTRTVNGKSQSYTKDHTAHESYYENKVYLLGGPDGEISIDPGHYEFPFQCFVPANCPSSFEGNYGHVRYTFKFVVDRKFKIDQEKKEEIKIFAPLDLNLEPYCKEPIQMEFLESFCCWCMNVGNCNVVVKLPVAGYVVGQPIPIEIGCMNNSTVEIDEIIVRLKKKISFHAPPSTKEENSMTLSEEKRGPVLQNSEKNWEVTLEPITDVINLNTCQYIDIDYELKVKICTSGCHVDGEQSVRLVFGHIPLTDSQALSIMGVTTNANIMGSQNHSAIPMQQYPIGNQAFPAANPPYPGANLLHYNSEPPPPYPGVNMPYPATNQQYHGANPPSYSNANAPYPPVSAPYPTNAPYPVETKSPILGFNVKDDRGESIPLLPPTANVPYPIEPQVKASAPEPSTPITLGPMVDDKKQTAENDEIERNPPYNHTIQKS